MIALLSGFCAVEFDVMISNLLAHYSFYPTTVHSATKLIKIDIFISNAIYTYVYVCT